MSEMVPANNTGPVLLQTMLYLATQMKRNITSNQFLDFPTEAKGKEFQIVEQLE